MNILTTDKGLSYEVDYAWAPLLDGSCRIQMPDNRALSVIGEEFEGLSRIHYINPNTTEYDFDGYNKLVGISYVDNSYDSVEIVLKHIDEDAQNDIN